jgi:hypothetical protein
VKFDELASEGSFEKEEDFLKKVLEERRILFLAVKEYFSMSGS